ncbi:MAG: LacI family DNA-binding transcriptional regulator [Anaerolineaceae bacterium]|nr:LacI family DNA-binding transcriptional regulator [Anaerolineaceae bacterium]
MPPQRSIVTIQDVARAAGVSVSTVSRVLNNKDDVALETVDHVRQVMEGLNYTASLAAKSMRSRTTRVIGLVLPDITGAFESEVIKGVGTALRGTGYDLLIYAADHPPLNRRPSWEWEHVMLLSKSMTDGTIIVTPSAPIFPEMRRIVIIDPLGDGANVPSVIATNRAGAISVMDYLTSIGHRRIGFIGGRPDTRSAIDRFEGYKYGLANAGLSYDSAMVQAGDYSRERGQESAHFLLTLPNPPTAIFAANDLSALGVMHVAKELNLRIPQDLSLVGFDNIPETTQVTPRLTTVDQSIQEMGALATKMLIDILQGREPECKLCEVLTHLVIRESCHPISSE